jgi:hypothetical protein
MSLVKYYIRLAPEQVEPLARLGVEGVYALPALDFPNADLLYLDGVWQTMAWLLSPKKRAEDAYMTGLVGDDMDDLSEATLALGREADAFPQDRALVAIEGGSDVVEERIEGLGPARLFASHEVVELATALSAFTGEDIRRAFDAPAMEANQVFPGDWIAEGQSILEEYVIPNFVRLQAFYTLAAATGQQMMVLTS